jgi:hypothetical protein
MNNHRIKRLLSVLAVLTASLVFAVGCGDDNDGSGGNNSGGDTPGVGGGTSGGGSSDQPENKDEAVDRCYEEAKKLEGQARETAEAGCKAADTGDTDELKDEARKQCLDAAKQIPDEAARKQAEDSCEQYTK